LLQGVYITDAARNPPRSLNVPTRQEISTRRCIRSSRRGTSRVEVFDNGNLDISFRVRSVTIGSLEGDGNAFLGAETLTVGSNNLSTTFSGVIQDGGGNPVTGGSLTKIGSGTLALSGANTYSGNTKYQRRRTEGRWLD
jgi:autotransporter-associated beta strand protein